MKRWYELLILKSFRRESRRRGIGRCRVLIEAGSRLRLMGWMCLCVWGSIFGFLDPCGAVRKKICKSLTLTHVVVLTPRCVSMRCANNVGQTRWNRPVSWLLQISESILYFSRTDVGKPGVIVQLWLPSWDVVFFQSDNLLSYLTVEETLTYTAQLALQKHSAEAIRKKVIPHDSFLCGHILWCVY